MIVFCNNMLTPYTDRVYTSLSKNGVKLSVISCTAKESNRSWNIQSKAYNHIVLNSITIKLGVSRYAHINHDLWSQLNKIKPSTVVINGFYPSMLIAALWCKYNNIPLHLSMDGWRETMPRTLYHSIIRPWIVKQCKSIVCCSSKGREYFLNDLEFDGSQIHVIPLVPSWDAPSPLKRIEDRLYDVMWCAHLENNTKNASFMVDIVKSMKDRNLNPGRWLIIGTGQEQNSILFQFDRLNLDYDHIPMVSWDKISNYYSDSKLFILPSLNEAWGLVCNEAMQCGTPCIVSPHVGASDDLVINEKNGYVLPLESDLWASKINEVLTNKKKHNKLSIDAHKDQISRDLKATVVLWKKWIDYVVNQSKVD